MICLPEVTQNNRRVKIQAAALVTAMTVSGLFYWTSKINHKYSVAVFSDTVYTGIAPV